MKRPYRRVFEETVVARSAAIPDPDVSAVLKRIVELTGSAYATQMLAEGTDAHLAGNSGAVFSNLVAPLVDKLLDNGIPVAASGLRALLALHGQWRAAADDGLVMLAHGLQPGSDSGWPAPRPMSAEEIDAVLRSASSRVVAWVGASHLAPWWDGFEAARVAGEVDVCLITLLDLYQERGPSPVLLALEEMLVLHDHVGIDLEGDVVTVARRVVRRRRDFGPGVR